MKILWMLLAISGANLAAAADETLRLAPAPLEIPARIGPLLFDGEPHKYEQAGLGVSYQYLGRGLSLTIYVYDLDVADIPDGGDTNIVCEQYEQAKSDVLHAGYADALVKKEQLVRLAPPADAPLAREAVFEYVRDGRPTLSYLWITAVAHNFVKLRFSMSTNLRDEAMDARRAVLSTLGAAIKQHLPPADAKADKHGTTLSLSSDDDMGTALMYSVLMTGVTEKSTDALPLCGGEFIPGYADELEVFQMLFAGDAGLVDTKLSRRMAKVAGAGFLEEFVWVERHRESWGNTPPEGLDFHGYESWKKKNLRRFHLPSMGSVVIDHPRPMPLISP